MSRTLHVVCPTCSSVNRMPADKPKARGKCGKCGAPLFLGTPVDLDEHSFAAHVTRSDIPALVDFWAPWCGPCKAMAPAFDQAAAQLEPHVRLCKLDTEAVPNVAARFGIRAIPTLILFRGGRESARLSGAVSLAQLLDWAGGHLELQT